MALRSLKILLDDCSSSKSLAEALRGKGFDTTTAHEAGLTGKRDIIVFNTGKRLKRVIVTHDPKDFTKLAEADSSHSGIVGVYRDPYGFHAGELSDALVYIDETTGDLTGQFVSANLVIHQMRLNKKSQE